MMARVSNVVVLRGPFVQVIGVNHPGVCFAHDPVFEHAASVYTAHHRCGDSRMAFARVKVSCLCLFGNVTARRGPRRISVSQVFVSANPCSLEDVAPLLRSSPAFSSERTKGAMRARAARTADGRVACVHRPAYRSHGFRRFIRRAQILSRLRSSRRNFTNQKVKALR